MGLNFRHRIKFITYERVGGLPGDGVEVLKAEAWADIRTLKGHEFNSAALAGNVGKSRFIIRYQPDIKPHYIIKYKNMEYDIESIENDDEQNRTMTIFVKGHQ